MGVIRSVFCVALALVLSACATEKDLYLSFVNKKCVAEADKEQSPVDWNQAKVLNIVIRDGVYDPDETHMKVGVPTILRIANNDSTERYFIDDDFFESVAVAQISVGDSKYDRPCVSGVIIEAGKKAELRLVPRTAGVFFTAGSLFWVLGYEQNKPGIIFVGG